MCFQTLLTIGRREMNVRESKARVNLALNTVRTVAAYMVVLGHVRALFFVDYDSSDSKSLLHTLFYILTSLGHPAVIVFFVLSGFWVGGAAQRSITDGSFSWMNYCVARLTRLWLVLIPALVLTHFLDRMGELVNAASDIYLGSNDYHTVVPVGGPLQNLDFVDTLGNAFFLQSIYVAPVGTNTPLWSLAYEFWYYIIFPALLLVVARKTGRRARVAAAVVVILSVCIAGPEVLALFPVWLAGAAIAWKGQGILVVLRRLAGVRLLVIRAFAVVLLFAVAGVSVLLRETGNALDYAVALAAVILVVAFSADVTRGKALIRPLSNAAEWSYTLYAIHLPITALLASFLVPLASERWQVSLGSAAAMATVILGVSLLCWLLSLITEARTSAVRSCVLKGVSRTSSRAARDDLRTTNVK